MDWSIILGILGIIVSAVVGWLTYKLADRRARNQRYINAKSTVLQELSKSLGEDSVPSPNVIQATMRSVVRETADPSLDIDLEEILDDLMRQVTADPFLDNERRSKLQSDIERVRAESAEAKVQLSREELHDLFERRGSPPSIATLMGMLASMVSAVAMMAFLFASMEDPERTHSLRRFVESLNNVDEGSPLPWIIGLSAVVVFFLIRLFADDEILPGLWAALRRWMGRGN